METDTQLSSMYSISQTRNPRVRLWRATAATCGGGVALLALPLEELEELALWTSFPSPSTSLSSLSSLGGAGPLIQPLLSLWRLSGVFLLSGSLHARKSRYTSPARERAVSQRHGGGKGGGYKRERKGRRSGASGWRFRLEQLILFANR